MTTSVDVWAPANCDAVVIKQDKTEGGEWVTVAREMVARDSIHHTHVWDTRRLIIEEIVK